MIPAFSMMVSERTGLLSISPSQITYLPQVIFTISDPITVSVSNIGDSSMQITSVMLSGTNPEGFILNDTNRYPATLAAGSTMYFTVTFHPTVILQYEAEILISDDLTRIYHSLPLSGSGNHVFIDDFPYSVGFESTSFPPVDWSVANSANSQYGWRRSTYGNAHTGSTYAAAGLRPGNHWLVTPSFIVTSQSNTLHFWIENGIETPDSAATSIDEYLDVLLSTSTADTSSFQPFLHYTNFTIPETYLEVIHDLSSYSGTLVRLAFMMHSTNGKYIYLDDLSISGPPAGTLNPPTNLNAEVETNKVYLTWQVPSHTIEEHLNGYKIYRNNILLQSTNTPQSVTYTDSTVAYGFYTYKVSALYGSIESVFSNSVGIDVSFGYPNLILADSFDSYPDFTTSLGQWTNLDLDQSNTFNFDEITYPNMTIPKAFVIFNPTETDPPMTYLSAHSGNKLLACFDSSNPPNNDWLISPRLSLGTNSSINFWAKSYTAYYGLEKFNLLVSLTGMNPENFISITGADTVHVPAVQWVLLNYDLSMFNNRTVYLAIQCVSDFAVALLIDDLKIISTGGSVDIEDHVVPTSQTTLLGNYPNPFNPETTIKFILKEKQQVSIDIFNTRGQKVKTLMEETRNPGIQTVMWNGKDNEDHSVATGVYFYQMKSGSYSQTKKMILLK